MRDLVTPLALLAFVGACAVAEPAPGIGGTWRGTARSTGHVATIVMNLQPQFGLLAGSGTFVEGTIAGAPGLPFTITRVASDTLRLGLNGTPGNRLAFAGHGGARFNIGVRHRWI